MPSPPLSAPADRAARSEPVLWTIGHGERSAEELLTLLRDHAIVVLADVRRFPASRRNPQFGREALEAELGANGIEYQWWGHELGGRRDPVPGVNRHPAWRNEAFRGYADHMDLPGFRATFSQLLAMAATAPTAIMCAETVWWRCHRRLLSDAAVLLGTPVVHLMSPDHSQPHRLNPAVRRGSDGWPVYDLGAQTELL
jgi:uncharacterized protein (DUF488 family)